MSRSRPRDVAILARHLANFGPLAALAAAAFWLALGRVPDAAPLARGGYGLLVALNVLVLAMSSWSTMLGAVLRLAGRRAIDLAGLRLRPPTGQARVAILFAIHEEDAAQVFAAARAIADDLPAEVGRAADVFMLSDSRTAAARADEQAMLARATRAEGPRLFYRRRAHNAGRKAGNVADFVRTWGGAYDLMLVLDADSLMTGACIARLVGAMEANPGTGLIQAMCYPVGRQTLFARIQQFDCRLVGPLFQAGVAFWQGPRGNYWGHNAIIRCAAFAASCGLPELPGRPPFGGEILSHDTVEAALLLRRGHDVWMLPAGPGGRPDGSWEETPTNLIDHLERDRRWLRGNLQHARVLAADGLRLASLYHLTRGLSHFLYAPLFVVWLVAYAALDRGARVDALALLVVALALTPRALGLAAALAQDDVRGFGGRVRLVAGAVLCQIGVVLLFPTVVVSHLVDLGGMLIGGETRWEVQSRSERGLAWSEAARALLPPVVAALAVLLAAAAAVAPLLGAWLVPGLAAAVPLAVATSRAQAGRRLFATPDETTPHPLRLRRRRIERLLRGGRPLEPGIAIAPLPPPCGLDMPVQALRSSVPTASARPKGD